MRAKLIGILPQLQSESETEQAVRDRFALPGIAAAVLLALFYLLSSIYIGSNRLFWLDELLTIHIARLADLKTIWSALAHGAEPQPPLYYVVVRAFGDLFGRGEVAARLPSTIGMAAGLLVIFDCARRQTNSLHGLIAPALAVCSFLPYYGYEARPYGLYFLFSAVALWVWACTPETRKSAVWFGVAIAFGVSFHYYFVLCLVPYAIWELVWGKRGRLASPKLIAGVVGAAIPLAVTAPLILSFSRNYGTGFWNHPSVFSLAEIYHQIFPDSWFVFPLVVAWSIVAASEKNRTAIPAIAPAELTGWLFLAIPLAGYVIAVLKTNAFHGRYFIGILPGVGVAFACWTWRHFRGSRWISAGILLVLAGWGAVSQGRVMRHPDKVEASGIRDFLAVQDLLAADHKRYSVFSAPLLFFEAEYYSEHPDQCYLLLPSDYDPEVDPRRFSTDPQLHDATLGALALEIGISKYHPLQFWKLRDLEAHLGEAAVVGPTKGILAELENAGIRMERVVQGPLPIDYPHR